MLPLWDPIHLRWYGFMFLLAFIVGQWILKRLARAGLLPIPEDKVYDLIVWLVLGVILGGRLGYATFYAQEMWLEPTSLFKLWKGGLSFHGGLLGVAVACLLFARKHKCPPLRIWDACALATPPGIAFVRFANFINGELYGRPVTGNGPPWAMRFPTDERAAQLLGLDRFEGRLKELAIRKSVHGEWPGMPEELRSVPAWDTVKVQVPLRHPSQLYEMVGEGVLVGVFLWLVWRATRARPLGVGVYGGIFLVAYGCVRFVIEWYRQPDAQFAKNGDIGTVWLGLSMGQLLCAAMVLAGAVLILMRWGKRPASVGAAAVSDG
jgi:phosphatidylglycerol:prolipoprotein diacylglycerol transferase